MRPTAKRIRGWLSLFACVGVIGLIWLVWLPQVTEGPTMQRIIKRHRAAGINAGAMVYTELGQVAGVRFEFEAGQPVLKKFTLNAGTAGEPQD